MAPTATTASGLRQRVLHASADTTAVLGVAHANAYFNARRLRQASGGGQAKRRKKGDDAAQLDQATAAAQQTKENASLFTVKPLGETVEALRRVDAREDAWRGAAHARAWPQFHQDFPTWTSELRAGFSVLLHGVGSKLALLQAFAHSLPETDYVVQVHGYLPAVVLRDLTDLLQHEVFAMPATDAAKTATRSFVQQCRAIVDFAFAHRHASFAHVVVVVHSLDGTALRDPQLQAGLARLAMAPFVHLVASVDSVNAPALWAEDDAQRFRWVHHRVDTLRPYVREIDLRLHREGKAAEQSISGVRYIMMSLTPTDVGTLRLIAQQQLACGAPSPSARRTDKFADYQAVYAASRKQLLHTSLQSLKNSIKCLEDNGLVKLLRVKNVEKLTIPLADELLRGDIIAPAKATK